MWFTIVCFTIMWFIWLCFNIMCSPCSSRAYTLIYCVHHPVLHYHVLIYHVFTILSFNIMCSLSCVHNQVLHYHVLHYDFLNYCVFPIMNLTIKCLTISSLPGNSKSQRIHITLCRTLILKLMWPSDTHSLSLNSPTLQAGWLVYTLPFSWYY